VPNGEEPHVAMRPDLAPAGHLSPSA
jgi:hypothetical protein